MAASPARLAGLARKGRIALGFDADLAVFAAGEAFVVDARWLAHRNPLAPYDGRALSGVVRHTWLRGRRVDVAGPADRAIAEEGSLMGVCTGKDGT